MAITHFRIQVSAASISLTASLILIIMIYFTPKRLSTPYRRLIFGMSVFDIIQSIGLLTGPFAVPSNDNPLKFPWARGTTATCELNGFISLLGTVAVPIYTFALSVRYYCKLNLKMEDAFFTKKIEVWFHVSVVMTLIIGFVGLAMNTFNPLPSGSFCYVEEYPFLCRDHPEWVGECQRGMGSDVISYLVTGITCLCFVGIIVNVSMLIVKSCRIEKLYRSRAGDPHHYAEYSCVRDYMCCIPCRNYSQLEHEPDADYVLRLYKKETVIQSLLYVGAFFACYAFPMMQTIGSFFNYQFPPAFLYLISIFYPLGGFFNVLTYTRPKVVRLRHAFPDFTRFKAFLIVMKAGGEIPDLNDNPHALEVCKSCPLTTCRDKRRRQVDEATVSENNVAANNLFEMLASMSD